MSIMRSIILLFGLCSIVQSEDIVLSPPYITKQPVDQYFYESVPSCGQIIKPIILECEADGSPTITYKWINGNGTDIQIMTFHHKISSTSGTLSILNPTSYDKGQYQCLATNEYGTAKSKIISVTKVPVNTLQNYYLKTLTPITSKEYTSLQLECKVPYDFRQHIVHWILQKSDGSFKYISKDHRIFIDTAGNLIFRYVISEDTTNEGFVYRCLINYLDQNEFKFSFKYSLEVIPNTAPYVAPQKLFATSNTYSAEEGETIKFYCIFGGFPAADIKWFYDNNTEIKSNNRIDLGTFKETLKIKNVTAEDAKTYVCKIKNTVETKHYINLSVHKKPYFTEEPTIQDVYSNQTDVSIRCAADGNPPPHVYWSYGSQRTTSSLKSYTFHIANANKFTLGPYTCFADNGYGIISKEVHLRLILK